MRKEDMKDFGVEMVAEEAIQRLISENQAVKDAIERLETANGAVASGGGLLVDLSVLRRLHVHVGRRSSLGRERARA